MKLLSILKKDILLLIRNKGDMVVLFLTPLAFIIPISLALGSGDGYGIQRNNRMILLPVINYDNQPRSQDLMAAIGESLILEKDYTEDQIQRLNLQNDPACITDKASPACHEKVARALLRRSQRSALLIIPMNFTQSVDSGKQVEIDLVFDPAGDSIQLQQIEGIVRGATVRMSVQNKVDTGLSQLSALVVYTPEEIRQSLEEDAAQEQPQDQEPAVNLRKVTPENYQFRGSPDTYQQTIPGYTVMFVFFITASITGSIRQEKLNGTFRRLLSAPTSRIELLGGKLLATLFVGVIQVVLLYLVGAMLFGLQLGDDPLGFLLITIALVLTAASLGLAVSATSIKSSAMSAPLIIFALLGGCMFPLDLMPPVLRSLSYIVPHSWALKGYQNLMVRGMGTQEILPQVGALLCFSLLFFLFAAWRFRFDDQETLS